MAMMMIQGLTSVNQYYQYHKLCGCSYSTPQIGKFDNSNHLSKRNQSQGKLRHHLLHLDSLYVPQFQCIVLYLLSFFVYMYFELDRTGVIMEKASIEISNFRLLDLENHLFSFISHHSCRNLLDNSLLYRVLRIVEQR